MATDMDAGRQVILTCVTTGSTPTSTAHAEQAAGRRLARFYNAMVNLWWSVPSLLPVVLYGYRAWSPAFAAACAATMVAPLLLPQRILHRFQPVTSAHTMRRLGVGWVKRLTQDGDVVNALVRRRYPGYRFMAGGRRNVRAVITRSAMYERFHWAAAACMGFMAGHALLQREWLWATGLLISNVIFNAYPILLQHYLRQRLRRVGALRKFKMADAGSGKT